jgi:hypothetical protein
MRCANASESRAPEPLVRDSFTAVVRAWEETCIQWHATYVRLRDAWKQAATEIKKSTGLVIETEPSVTEPLNRLSNREIDTQAHAVSADLAACETWNALRIKSHEAGFLLRLGVYATAPRF